MALNVNDYRVCRASFHILDEAAFAPAGVETRTLADPDTITLAVTSPSGVVATYNYPGTIVRRSLGAYTQRVLCSATGTWTAVWTGTGSAAGAEPDSWVVA